MTEDDDILIERYIQGSMSTKEIEDFEMRLSIDEAFRKSYDSSKAAFNFIKEAGRIELKETLNSFEKSKQKTIKSRRIYLIAASVVLLMGFYFMTDFFSSKSTLQVYELYFETYDAPSILRGDLIEDTPIWDTAVDFYKNENFNEALNNFEQAETYILKDKVAFYIAMCELELENSNLDTTLHRLKNISKGNSNYQEQALWYYALGNLKKGNKKEALNSFEEIIKNQSFGHEKAKEIIALTIKD